MGVPKFFRWISERYPLIIQPLTENTVPSIDNLYLDMNGIIHNCTHANDDRLRILSNKQMLFAIFQYIDKLFTVIKPKKYFFMAIDGVAPRAKMNQQRQRRFRAAQDAEQARNLAVKRGEQVPKEEDVFDSNCITPGTEFMAALSEHLKYFIRKKMEDDLAWRRCKVIFSGHEVPGEGEHKIMEFIRGRKSEPGYQPNETHCLYGLDADLIMLSLASHEPHFCLLREQVQFGRPKVDKKKPQQKDILENIVPATDKFQLLHVSLLREYFDLEFNTMNTPFPYDLERVIDDFVLMCFFVGNDFLPHLPTFDIGEGALNSLFEIYKQVLPGLGGYLTDGANIDFDRLEVLLYHLGQLEHGVLNERVKARLKERKKGKRFGLKAGFRGRIIEKANGSTAGTMQIVETVTVEGDEGDEDDEETFGEIDDATMANTLARETGSLQQTGTTSRFRELQFASHLLGPDSSDQQLRLEDDGLEGAKGVFEFTGYNDLEIDRDGLKENPWETVGDEEWVDVLLSSRKEGTNDIDFNAFKENYYKEKLQIAISEQPEELRKLVKAYLEGLSWVMKYYYCGCPSWKWFYPYHYAPMASDLLDLKNISKEISFTLSTPFLPFQQLLGVLPARSRRFLPKAYQSLMFSNDSPIIDFYPTSFVIDREGKKNEWEGVALLPLIDEDRLIAAMSQADAALTPEERKRNSFGRNLLFVYDKNISYEYDSPLPEVFPKITKCHAKCNLYDIPDGSKFIPRLVPGVSLEGVEGFPTFKTKQISTELRAIGLNIFGNASKKETRIIKIHDVEPPSAEELAGKLLKQTVYVGYPYLREALVTAISDENATFTSFGNSEQHGPMDRAEFVKEAGYHQSILMSKQGLDIGNTKVMIYVKVFDGMKKGLNGNLIKSFSNDELAYPLQLTVLDYNPAVKDARFATREASASSLREEFKVGSEILYLGEGPCYGAEGIVTSVDHRTLSISLSVPMHGPDLSKAFEGEDVSNQRYYKIGEIARKANISPLVLSKLTGSLTTFPEKTEIGLGLKFQKKNMRVQGYARKEVYSSDSNNLAYHLHNRGFEAQPNKFSIAGRDGAWELSEKALRLIKAYKQKFPQLFEALEQYAQSETFDSKLLFPEGNHAEMLQEITQWLSEQEVSKLPLIPCDVEVLSEETKMKIEEAKQAFLASPQSKEFATVKMTGVSPTLVYNPNDPLPSFDGNIMLGDRVVNMRSSGAVPFGLRGTVVGIRGDTADVMFDTEFIGGKARSGSSHRSQVVPLKTLLNLSEPTPRQSKYKPQIVFDSSVARQQPHPRRQQPQQQPHPKAPFAQPVHHHQQQQQQQSKAAPMQQHHRHPQQQQQQQPVQLMKRVDNNNNATVDGVASALGNVQIQPQKPRRERKERAPHNQQQPSAVVDANNNNNNNGTGWDPAQYFKNIYNKNRQQRQERRRNNNANAPTTDNNGAVSYNAVPPPLFFFQAPAVQQQVTQFQQQPQPQQQQPQQHSARHHRGFGYRNKPQGDRKDQAAASNIYNNNSNKSNIHTNGQPDNGNNDNGQQRRPRRSERIKKRMEQQQQQQQQQQQTAVNNNNDSAAASSLTWQQQTLM